MAFKLSEVDVAADFDKLMACQWLAHEDPFQPFYRLFCPVFESGREASVKESTERLLAWHEHDPHARWLKVEESETGHIVGGAWYKIYAENPFEHPEDEVADWYPDDSSRDFVSQAIGQMDVPRMKKATRPQVCTYTAAGSPNTHSRLSDRRAVLNILFAHPHYRHKGIGSMLLQWGIDTAKELGIEFWLNATPMGKPLYEKHGFEIVEENPLKPTTTNPDETWKAMEKQFEGVVFWTMWLPKEGGGARPWEQ